MQIYIQLKQKGVTRLRIIKYMQKKRKYKHVALNIPSMNPTNCCHCLPLLENVLKEKEEC